MKILLSMLVTLSVNGASPPQITYGSKVRILKGFYQGCVGVAVEEVGDSIVIRDLKCEGSLKKGDVLIAESNLRKVQK